MAKQIKKTDHNYLEVIRRIKLLYSHGRGGKVLNLANLGLTKLPPAIGMLTSLTTLDLSNNQLAALPEDFSRLSALTALDLRGNQFTTVPSEICQLATLKKLSLSKNQLTVLPPIFGMLSSLTTLVLSGNKLSSLPIEIDRLSELAVLDLSGNQFTTTPSDICKLTALTTLIFSANRLNTLPSEIDNLASLTAIDLNHNKFNSFPKEICRLSSLTKLSLIGNQLTVLPPEIGRLTALITLSLGDNQLTTLPTEIGRLSHLEQLTLERNSLRELPQSLQALKLRELTLSGNESLALPSELLNPPAARPNYGNRWSNPTLNPPATPRAILDFYFSRQAEGEEPMQEVRLLLVGRGRVGKTSLLKTLLGERPNEKEPETPGITVQSIDLACPQGKATGHVWDFGGQEFLHGTHQIFLSERCVYLLVLEGRESNWETETDYWLRFIQSFGGDSPVIVVLTKYDEHPFSVDRYRLQERCPQIAAFVETDAFTGRGIEELRGCLANSVGQMKDVWLGVPKKWHSVKKTLMQMPQSFLEYREYQLLCKENGVDGAGKQDSLAQTLHRLGIALNFRDHHRLRDTSVLKPKWVTEAIYGLIRYVQKQDCHGVMQRRWLSQALERVEYPETKHQFVLELMEKFEVAFPLEGTQSWLIPELLREDQPEPFAEFREAKARRLRFFYPEALPPGLLPRFIVRTHEMSEARPNWRWRSGVVLEWGGCRALVRLNRTERRTEVAVIDCPRDDQQNLFDLIRAHLTILHGKVRVVEEVEIEGHPDSWVRLGKLRLLEEEGTTHTKEDTKNGELATVEVIQTLDHVESKEAREADRNNALPRMRLFVSYAHDDAKKIRPLSKHLTILGGRGYIQTWQDNDLVAGEAWKDRILEELERADIVLMLYSTNSRASTFIQKIEAPKAVERANTKVQPCTLIVAPLDRKDFDKNDSLEQHLQVFQTATWNAQPVLDFAPQSKGWQQVEHSIRNAVELRRKGLRTIGRSDL